MSDLSSEEEAEEAEPDLGVRPGAVGGAAGGSAATGGGGPAAGG